MQSFARLESGNCTAVRLCVALMMASCTPKTGSIVAVPTFVGNPSAASLTSLSLFARAELRPGDPTLPGTVLESLGPLPGSTASVTLGSVARGTQRFVILEWRESTSSDSQVDAYGISMDLELKPGAHLSIEVPIKAAPSGAASHASVLPTLTAEEDLTPDGGLVPPIVSTSQVRLELESDTGVTVKLANDPGLIPGATPQALGTAQTTSAASSTWVLSGWDLSANLLPLLQTTCDLTQRTTGCPRRVYVQFVDDDRYTSPVVAADAVLDQVPPSLVGPIDVGYSPGSSNILATVPSVLPSAATDGTTISVSFTVSEQLWEDPAVSLASPAGVPATGGPVFARVSRVGTTYVYAGLPGPSVAIGDGSYGVLITAADLAGNIGTLLPAAPRVQLDRTPPDDPQTSTAGLIEYTRIPWGDDATAGAPRFAVSGGPGATDPGATVLAYDAPDPWSALLLGSTTSDSDGGFSACDAGTCGFLLSPADRTAVYLLAVDEAGNASTGGTEAGLGVLVHDVTWKATLGGGGTAPLAANPHESIVTTNFLAGPDGGLTLGELTQERAFASTPPAETPLARIDGISISTTSVGLAWTEVTPSANPPARTLPGATFDRVRGRGVLFGGATDTGALLGDLWEWDGQAWTRQYPLGSGPTPRVGQGFVYEAARGLALLFGGQDANGCQDDTWEWDGSGWTLVPPVGLAPAPRQNHAMAYDSARGVTVLFGGEDTGGNLLCDTWEWNGSSWCDATPGGVSLCSHVAGTPCPLAPGVTTGTGTPSGRYGAALVYDPSMEYEGTVGLTFLFGGNDGNPEDDLWIWDPVHHNWTEPSTGGGPQPRWGHSLVFDPAAAVVQLVGGTADGQSALFSSNDNTLADDWTWNGNTWSQATAAPSPRWNMGAAYDTAREQLLAYAGSTTSEVLADTWRLREGAEAGEDATPGTSAPTARAEAAMAFDEDAGVAVLFGGEDGAGVLGDTWEWNGASWTQLAPAVAPAARHGHSLAFDTNRQVSVLFGGEDSSPSWRGDVAEWDSASETWTVINPAGTRCASPRTGAALAFDSGANLTWVFGGYGLAQSSCGDPTGSCPSGNACGVFLNDLWGWNGQTWTPGVPTAGAPPAREFAGMTYDTARRRVVLFGGVQANSQLLGDTWEWSADNGTWTQAATTGTAPSGRAHPLLAYDSTRGVSTLFGGLDAQGYRSDAWEWNGTSWTEQDEAPLSTPQERAAAAGTYDSLRASFLLFGGSAAAGFLADTWFAPSDLARRGGVLASFDVSAIADPDAAIDSLTFEAFAGAQGGTLVGPPGSGANLPGATLAVWDALTGEWRAVAAGVGVPTAPAIMSYQTGSGAEANADVLQSPTSKSVNLAVVPTTGRGNDPTQTAIAVDYLELTVKYKH